MRSAVCIAAAAFACSSLVAAQVRERSGPVLHDTLRERQLVGQVKAADGFKVTLFAGPPVAMYPTCLTSTIDGAVFVCVDPNLSLSATKGTGRVVRLVDANNDGVADRYTVFAEMDSPRGLAFDGQTLYVMHPPVLTAYRDTDGDGISDQSEDLVTGLGFGLDFRGADHGTNGIALAIDGWIYIAVGDYSYRHAVGKDGTAIEHRGGTVVRVRTDGSGLEIYAQGTRNMYDLAVDPLLHVFSRDNTNDGDGWDTRLHYLAPGANMGYPVFYKNFPSEHFQSLADYGSGSGTGGLWVHDPGFPEGFNNTLYTGDWTVNKVLRHPLRAKGASYDIEQVTFLDIPHPADMAMDGQSNMYVASLSGGSFNYIGDTVGYVIRVSAMAGTPSKAPPIAMLKDAELVALIAAPVADHRLQAQRELLRRHERSGMAKGLTAIMSDKKRPAYARVAAMFTLKQLIGDKSHKDILKVAADPAVRALALRALSDNKAQLAGVTPALFVTALSDTSPVVQLAAIAALVHIDARDAAPAVVPLTGSADPAVAHIATNALVALNAWQPALAAVGGASAAVRTGTLRALQQMHDSTVVAAMIAKVGATSDPATKRETIVALARLYNREASWKGDWWGTRPSFIGPYFAPVPWESSPQILPVLRRALADASSSDLPAAVDEFVRNRVLPQGAKALMLAAAADASMRDNVFDALLGNSVLTAPALPVLAHLNQSAAARTGVAELLAGESGIVDGSLPLVRTASLDSTIDQEARRKLLGLVGAIPGRPGMTAGADIFSQLNPTPAQSANADAAGPAEAAWRRYVGDRRHLQELDFFIDLSRAAQPAQRTLAFAVLVQSVRGNRVAADVTAKVAPVLDAAFRSRNASPDLERAITIMRLGTQYAARLDSLHTRQQAPAAPAMDWMPLFNGKDLKDWDIKFAGYPVGENFRNTFRVEDGMLKVRYDQWTSFSGEFGHIFHKKPFSYYIVAAEYRFVGEQVTGAGPDVSWAIRNNGIMVHSQSATSMGLKQDFPISLEVQLLGGLGRGTRTNGNLCTPGTNVVMNDKLVTTHCINSNSLTYDGDQWVRVEAMVLGDSVIKHIVNGDTVLTYFKPQMGGGNANNTNPGVLVNGQLLSSGYITLQAETAPIDFRKVEIVNLVGCMDPKSPSYRAYFVKADPAACKR
jgi:glucose/arabinose dehydrogenase